MHRQHPRPVEGGSYHRQIEDSMSSMLLGFGESSVLSIEDDLLIGEISTSPEVGVKSDEDDPAGDVGDVCGF